MPASLCVFPRRFARSICWGCASFSRRTRSGTGATGTPVPSKLLIWPCSSRRSWWYAIWWTVPGFSLATGEPSVHFHLFVFHFNFDFYFEFQVLYIWTLSSYLLQHGRSAEELHRSPGVHFHADRTAAGRGQPESVPSEAGALPAQRRLPLAPGVCPILRGSALPGSAEFRRLFPLLWWALLAALWQSRRGRASGRRALSRLHPGQRAQAHPLWPGHGDTPAGWEPDRAGDLRQYRLGSRKYARIRDG